MGGREYNRAFEMRRTIHMYVTVCMKQFLYVECLGLTYVIITTMRNDEGKHKGKIK